MNTEDNATKSSSFLADNGKLVDRKLYEVPIGALIPDPAQPRKYFEPLAIADLQASIEKHGVLQPIIFRQDADGNLIIVSGERRYRASQLAKKTTIPAIFNTSGNATEITLVENLQRENLNPIEEAEGLKRLQDEKSYTGSEISAVLGKAESTISEILSLNKLPKSVKDACRSDAKISRRALVEIAKGKDKNAMVKLFDKYKKKAMKSDDLRTLSRAKQSPSDIWLKKIDGFAVKVKGLYFSALGGDSDAVKKQLKALMTTIKKQLA